MPACVRVCLVGVGVVTSFRVWVGCGMEWQGSADFWGWVSAGVDQYLMQDCTKEWRRAEAKVRRICKPTSRSRNVAASPDIVSRWDAGG